MNGTCLTRLTRHGRDIRKFGHEFNLSPVAYTLLLTASKLPPPPPLYIFKAEKRKISLVQKEKVVRFIFTTPK